MPKLPQTPADNKRNLRPQATENDLKLADYKRHCERVIAERADRDSLADALTTAADALKLLAAAVQKGKTHV